jgi:hypothetical protein
VDYGPDLADECAYRDIGRCKGRRRAVALLPWGTRCDSQGGTGNAHAAARWTPPLTDASRVPRPRAPVRASPGSTSSSTARAALKVRPFGGRPLLWRELAGEAATLLEQAWPLFDANELFCADEGSDPATPKFELGDEVPRQGAALPLSALAWPDGRLLQRADRSTAGCARPVRVPSGTGRRGVEPTLGFEPRTCCLRNSCSTAELCRRGRHSSSPRRARSSLGSPRRCAPLHGRIVDQRQTQYTRDWGTCQLPSGGDDHMQDARATCRPPTSVRQGAGDCPGPAGSNAPGTNVRRPASRAAAAWRSS